MPSDSVLYLAKRTKLIITAVLLSKPFLTKLVYSQSCVLTSLFFCNIIIEHLKRVFKHYRGNRRFWCVCMLLTLCQCWQGIRHNWQENKQSSSLSALAAFKSCLVLLQRTSTCSVNNSHDKDEPVWVCIIAKKASHIAVRLAVVQSCSAPCGLALPYSLSVTMSQNRAETGLRTHSKACVALQKHL